MLILAMAIKRPPSWEETQGQGIQTPSSIERLTGLLNPITKPIRWCRWKKPEIGCIKLNTDGSVDAKNSSFGGLFRDHKGEPLCAFVSKAPQDDTFLVELWAVWRGLILASGLGIKVIWVESDSKSVVKTINQEQPYGPKGSRCLREIWKLLAKFETYCVTHSWRESNKAADHLSRMCVRENDVVLWPSDFPDVLHNIIKDDALGTIYFRR
ncbi:Detected protein of confused Function [Hibiscus syriacus]|uniref:Detected protein of confused Function n=1 Tax=Hibiscus syriacus TaxID=106335 RepID=A0A6A2ZTR8_HIBSY|nr:Detected protein of confused Function [Hibiscus syriacus]